LGTIIIISVFYLKDFLFQRTGYSQAAFFSRLHEIILVTILENY